MTQTIGQRLKAEREEQRLTLEKVFQATRIRVPYLQALEDDDLSRMPSPVQARGYLRNYAEYLGFDVEQLLRELQEMNDQPAPVKVIGPADIPSPPSIPETNLVVDPGPAIQIPPLNAVQEPIIPIKPKSGCRKKADGLASLPQPAAAEPPTRRRGRKKAEPEVLPVLEPSPNLQNRVEETSIPTEPVPLPEQVEDVAASSAPPIQAEAEATPMEAVREQNDESIPVDVSDSLWQTWLSRVSSILAARAKRRTLIPNESTVVEPAPDVALPDVAPEVEPDALAFENSKQILKEIGRELRLRRELLSLHFDEVERNTHVKAHYLDALERGALDELPSTVQTRGMLSNYATFLDLDVDVLLLRFADALQARHRERNPHKPARKPGQPIVANLPPVRTFIAGDMIFGVGMAVLLVGFAIWGVSRVMAIQSQQEVNPTSPSISDVLLSYPNQALSTPTVTFLPAVEAFPGEPTVTVEIPTQNVNAEVQLNLVAVERTYMRVIVDGEVAFDGRVVPGNAYPFEAEGQIEVLVGSGAAIRIVYNGRDLGLMGTFGQVVNNIYLGTEIITPTAQPSVTPTITSTPTNTASPTATPRFTSTPVPSATAVP
jgi:cytoskeletal protein RodZ